MSTDIFNLFLRDAFSNTPFQSVYEKHKITYPVNIKTNNDSIFYEISALGLSKEDIDIEIENKTITVKSKLNENSPSNSCIKYLYKGIKDSNFFIQFILSNEYNEDSAKVTLDKGLLQIVFNKNESLKPKKLQILETIDTKLIEQ